MVPVGAEVLHSAAEQPPLHACLDHQGQVVLSQHFDAGDGAAWVAGATIRDPEAGAGDAGRYQVPELGQRPIAGVVHAQLVIEGQIQICQL